MKRCEEIIARYPPQYKKAAVMPILDIGQRQNKGWTSISVMNAVAKLLEMPKMRVYEVSWTDPGKGTADGRSQPSTQCTTENPSLPTSYKSAPPLLVSSEDVDPTRSWMSFTTSWVSSPDNRQRTENSHCWRSSVWELAPTHLVSWIYPRTDGQLTDVVMQIGDDYYEDLTPETTVKILDALAKGEKPKPGPQTGRYTSENSAGLTS
jgi:NADH dehydrogenase (ubiquinone) flavoprotein 2